MARNIMIQGTMSNAGKSILCAALCRVLKQDGLRVVPFKSQNMALNSGVTWDGLEMGRAQILQAQAAGVEPDVRMNPILLKPCSDTGSQVIVNGKVIGQYSARAYFAMKKSLIPAVMVSYESLANEADVVVIEGAGSPAEINLKQDDIVNMGLARMVGAPVLLAGDIDPGGVFAQLYGTVKLLEEEEQRRIKGLIINKFRGDRSLLTPGIDLLEEKLDIPVVGILPYLRIGLEEEDSLSERLRKRSHTKPLDAAVIRFPRISNYTDFDALEEHPLIGVRYVEEKNEFGMPDLVILPGSKSTLADLRWLRETGLSDLVLASAQNGTFTLGICGGYQMLGEAVCDPEGTEGGATTRCVTGLGLLPVRTVFRRRKVRRKVSGTIREGFLTGAWVYGYEIHMGDTQLLDECHAVDAKVAASEPDVVGIRPPLMTARGNVCGTYLHGLFDSGQAVDRLANLLAGRKGVLLSGYQSEDRNQSRERQLDQLADAFRRNMDMERIYRIIEEGAAAP